jgi:hypothetical protein
MKVRKKSGICPQFCGATRAQYRRNPNSPSEVVMLRDRFASLVMLILLASPVLDACGDKFLLVGRGLAFGRAYASVYPGSIVIYSEPATARDRKKLHDNIRKAGHRVTLVTSVAELSARLQQTDIVIADMTSRSALDAQVAAMTIRPSLLFLVSEGGQIGDDIPADTGVVKNGEKPGRFLAVIEDIMKTRQQAGVRVRRS